MATHQENNNTSSILTSVSCISLIPHTSCHHAVGSENSKWTVRKEPWAGILACHSLIHVWAAGNALASSHWTVGGTILVFWEKGNVVTLLVQARTKANGRGRRKESWRQKGSREWPNYRPCNIMSLKLFDSCPVPWVKWFRLASQSKLFKLLSLFLSFFIASSNK